MGTEGWGFVAELDGAALNQLVVKAWQYAEAKLAAIEKPFTGKVPIEFGLELYYEAQVQFTTLPNDHAGGKGGQPIHAIAYADAHQRIIVRLAIAVALDLRAELRFPGELGGAREAGEFIHSVVSTVWFAETTVTRAGAGTPQERLVLDVNSIRIDHIDFLGVQPPPSVVDFINKLARLLLPRFMASADIAVSPLYGALTGTGMISPRADYRAKTLDPAGADVTGQLAGDARFDSALRTFVSIGLCFSFPGHPAPLPSEIPFRLPERPGQTLALSTTNWALTFIRSNTVPKMMDDAVRQKIGDKPHRGKMAIDVFHGGQITDSDDDGILVITDVSHLAWDGSRLGVTVEAYEIQRGLFGWDDLAPDIQITVDLSFGIKPNDSPGPDGNIDYSKPLLDDVRLNFYRDESIWDAITAPFVMVEKFTMSIADVLTGQWGDALRNGVEIFADVPLLITFVGFFVALFGGVSIGDQGVIPSLKFAAGQEVELDMTIRPQDFPGGAPFNAFTLYMTIR